MICKKCWCHPPWASLRHNPECLCMGCWPPVVSKMVSTHVSSFLTTLTSLELVTLCPPSPSPHPNIEAFMHINPAADIGLIWTWLLKMKLFGQEFHCFLYRSPCRLLPTVWTETDCSLLHHCYSFSVQAAFTPCVCRKGKKCEQILAYLQALLDYINRCHKTVTDDGGNWSSSGWGYRVVARLVSPQQLLWHLISCKIHSMHWPAETFTAQPMQATARFLHTRINNVAVISMEIWPDDKLQLYPVVWACCFEWSKTVWLWAWEALPCRAGHCPEATVETIHTLSPDDCFYCMWHGQPMKLQDAS